MNIKLTSYGATEEVTGSCHLLNIDGYRILVDCGMWQGNWENYSKNWDNFLFAPSDIDAVILTHAHLDHCGRLPKLYQGGYKGPIYATPPTIELARIVLEDSSKIMTEKAWRKKFPLLYSNQNLKKAYGAFTPIHYYQNKKLSDNISFTLHNAGHILGSSIVEIKAGDKTIVFSGDIGGEDMPLVKDIDYLPKADFVVCEGTYGDRVHEDLQTRDKQLLEAVKRVTLNNSTLLITIFALERTQDILKVLNDYYESHLDFNVPVYLDSPMAAEATRVYQKDLEYLNDDAQETLQRDRDIFSFPHLKITNHIRASKQINTVIPPKIILAGSGMMEGGRMIHHLGHYAGDPKNHILFMGFQVPGTLGSKILAGNFDFDYFGRKIPIRAGTDQIDGFSAHADKRALLKWLGAFKNSPQTLLVHGDKDVLKSFAQSIDKELQFDTIVMEKNKTICLT